MSAVHLSTGTLVEDVLGALARHGTTAGCLVLELTETALARNSGSARAQLSELREHGVRVAIDDFGSGYSSLSAVASLPADVIKVDRALVSGPLPAGPAAPAAVLRAITALGSALGMEVLAEGVETAEQLELVRAAGCTHVQGHHLSPALPPGELAALLDRRPAGRPAARSCRCPETQQSSHPVRVGALCSCWGSGGAEHGLDLELDGDLVADDDAAAVHRHVDVHAELLAGDLGLGGEAGARAAVGVRAEAVELERRA